MKQFNIEIIGETIISVKKQKLNFKFFKFWI